VLRALDEHHIAVSWASNALVANRLARNLHSGTRGPGTRTGLRMAGCESREKTPDRQRGSILRPERMGTAPLLSRLIFDPTAVARSGILLSGRDGNRPVEPASVVGVPGAVRPLRHQLSAPSAVTATPASFDRVYVTWVDNRATKTGSKFISRDLRDEVRSRSFAVGALILMALRRGGSNRGHSSTTSSISRLGIL
jgi:hypothetical protein